MSAACSTRTFSTRSPLRSLPMSAAACARASSAFCASLMPPAFPLPPTCTCAFTTTGPPSDVATAAASSAENATPPFGMGMPASASTCFAWNSCSFTGHSMLKEPAGLRFDLADESWEIREDPVRRRGDELSHGGARAGELVLIEHAGRPAGRDEDVDGVVVPDDPRLGDLGRLADVEVVADRPLALDP